MAYDMYQERILQHYRNPKHFGQLDHPDLSAEESNPLCGDHIRIDIQLDPSQQKVAEIRFSGDGCAISIASASMLTQKLAGQPLSVVEKVTQDDVLELVAIPLSPVRVKCALTGFTALGRALQGHAASPEPPRA